MWLSEHNSHGDVLAELRGGKEDRRLKGSFERVCEKGSDFIKPEQFAARLTNRQLKVKNKSNNIAGLQIADLLAHPSYRACLLRHEHQALRGPWYIRDDHPSRPWHGATITAPPAIRCAETGTFPFTYPHTPPPVSTPATTHPPPAPPRFYTP